MTFCEILKKGTTERGREVIAEREMSKYADVWEYSVSICEGSTAILTEKCAKTTWRKKFEQMRLYSGL